MSWSFHAMTFPGNLSAEELKLAYRKFLEEECHWSGWWEFEEGWKCRARDLEGSAFGDTLVVHHEPVYSDYNEARHSIEQCHWSGRGQPNAVRVSHLSNGGEVLPGPLGWIDGEISILEAMGTEADSSLECARLQRVEIEKEVAGYSKSDDGTTWLVGTWILDLRDLYPEPDEMVPVGTRTTLLATEIW